MIDLRSDTVTKPDEAMREAIADADVGDDVYGEDPTVNELEARVAEVLGTEAALLCPSGTMANQIAIDVHTDPGQELVLERASHIYRYELGGAARHAGLQTRPLDGRPRGVLEPDQVTDAMRTEALHVAGTGLLALENTHNNYGGRALAPEVVAAAAGPARDRDVPVHLDGARLWNAAVAHSVEPSAFVEPVDSVMVSLSKGLGAPIGSMLAGSASFVERARRSRKAFGGGMRQAGVLAAAGLVGLDRREELARDHALAATLAEGLDGLEGLDVVAPESNILVIHLDDDFVDAEGWLAAGRDAGVLGTDVGAQTVRYVAHRDVDGDAVDRAIEALHEVHRQLA
ncbi:MAG: threonine aldolase family protein [Halobacteriales archaeon]